MEEKKSDLLCAFFHMGRPVILIGRKPWESLSGINDFIRPCDERLGGQLTLADLDHGLSQAGKATLWVDLTHISDNAAINKLKQMFDSNSQHKCMLVGYINVDQRPVDLHIGTLINHSFCMSL